MSTGNKSLDGNQEFQIQSEDFPALPGSNSQQMQGDSGLGGVGGGGVLGGISPQSHTHLLHDSKEIGSDTYCK